MPYHTVMYMGASLLWYDLETFGIHPLSDRIAQYAAIRTDDKFAEIEAPVVCYCRLGMDYVPNPESCLITRITPQYANEKGITEAEFVRRIRRQMLVPNTCVVGYNSLRFDDEFIRNLFYRNFCDPYDREYANGNSRWDIIDLARMAHDFRPDGISWVYDENRRPSFRLQELASANGIEIDRAHEALSDVRATIGLAKLIHNKQPKLFHYYFSMRMKQNVRALVNLQHPKPITFTSSVFTRPSGCTSVVYPISAIPDRENAIIAYDLRFDPSDWLGLPVAELRRRIFSPGTEYQEKDHIHLIEIRLNRCPGVAPLNTLDEERSKALSIDTKTCLNHARRLVDQPELAQKVRSVFSMERAAPYQDADYQIYSGGFFGDEDRAAMKSIRNASPKELISSNPAFIDPRGPELFRRYLGRNYYDLLPQKEKSRWKSHCAGVLLAPELDSVLDISKFKKQVHSLLSSGTTPAEDKAILYQLSEYARWLEETVLS